MDRFLRVADAPLRGLRRPLSARAAKPGHWPAPWARPRLRFSPGSRGRAVAAHASDLRFAGGRTPAPAAVRRPEAPKRWPAPGLAWTPRRARWLPALAVLPIRTATLLALALALALALRPRQLAWGPAEWSAAGRRQAPRAGRREASRSARRLSRRPPSFRRPCRTVAWAPAVGARAGPVRRRSAARAAAEGGQGCRTTRAEPYLRRSA